MKIKIVLASASERRRLLLSQAGFTFETVTSDFDEKTLMGEKTAPYKLAKSIALCKAKSCATDYDNVLLIAADTIVFQKGSVFGKPKNYDDAKRMLKALSGNTHTVYTGVAVILKQNGIESETCFHEKARVTLAEMTDSEIDSYLSTGEPFGRAGAYTLAEIGSMLVKSINGSYTTVLGLPMHRLYKELRKLGFDPLSTNRQK